MKAFEEAIQQLEAERAEFNRFIDGKIEGLRQAIRIHSGAPSAPAAALPRIRVRRGNLKETVIDLLTDAGSAGLTSDQVVAQAKIAKGIELIPGSVSSLLSRLKHDGVLVFDGQRYRVKDLKAQQSAA